MSSYENSSLSEIAAALDGIEEATPEQVFQATRPYSPREIAAVAASKADAAGAGGGEGSFSVATLVLDNDEIKSLGTGLTIPAVAAPGAGAVLLPVFASVVCDATAGAYTFGDSSYVAIGYDGGSTAMQGAIAALSYGEQLQHLFGTYGEVGFAPFLPAQQGSDVGGPIAAQAYDASEGEGLALGVTGSNSTGFTDFGGGHADNWLRVKIWYTTVDLTAP